MGATDRGLPHNWETERALLGGLLLAPERLADVREILTSTDLHRPAHQSLFGLMCEIADRRHSPDLILVTDAIEAQKIAEKVGGIAYVCALPQACPSVDLVDRYAASIRETSVRRQTLEMAQELVEDVHRGVKPAADLIDGAEQALFRLAGAVASDTVRSIGELCDQVTAGVEARGANPGAISGVPTGFGDLDRKLAGLQRTDLVILAARPAMGKTAMVLNIAANAARKGTGVAVFSLEMSATQLVQRCIVAEARIDASVVRTGELSRDDWSRWHVAEQQVRGLPLYIDDTPGLTIGALRSRARRLKAQHPEIGLVVVDYLQLMQGSGNAKESRENAISAISRGLKILAKELDVPVLALSQLNRGLEARQDKRPLPSDLRESGAIEQDADVILFIYRDEVYNGDASPKKGIAEVIIAKQRSGPIGTVELAFIDKYTLFQSLSRAEDDGQRGFW